MWSQSEWGRLDTSSYSLKINRATSRKLFKAPPTHRKPTFHEESTRNAQQKKPKEIWNSQSKKQKLYTFRKGP